jgi:hypothetical protein
MKEELTLASAKAAPPVAIAGSQVMFDLTLNEWVAIATLAYLALQTFVLLRNEWRRRKT